MIRMHEAAAKDKLDVMMEQQREFMLLLQKKRGFPNFPVDLSSKDGQRFLKEISYETVGELFEAIQHLRNSKRHRLTDTNEIDHGLYLEELVDVLHYYFEIVIASGISAEELYDAYINKGKVNVKRIEQGYLLFSLNA